MPYSKSTQLFLQWEVHLISVDEQRCNGLALWGSLPHIRSTANIPFICIRFSRSDFQEKKKKPSISTTYCTGSVPLYDSFYLFYYSLNTDSLDVPCRVCNRTFSLKSYSLLFSLGSVEYCEWFLFLFLIKAKMIMTRMETSMVNYQKLLFSSRKLELFSQLYILTSGTEIHKMQLLTIWTRALWEVSCKLSSSTPVVLDKPLSYLQ